MKKPNEQDAAGAFRFIFHLMTGVRYHEPTSPDERGLSTPEVDFLFEPEVPSAPTLAVEHTILEGYEGQLKYIKTSFELVEIVNSKCSGKLPMDRYFTLVIPPEIGEVVWLESRESFVDQVSSWAISEAPKLSYRAHSFLKFQEGKVLLICGGSNPTRNGLLGRIPGQPGDSETLQDARLWSAITHGIEKFPKYQSPGFKTVLLLEDITCSVQKPQFLDAESDDPRKLVVDQMIGYIVLFSSIDGQMIAAAVWKELETWYDDVPFHRRFNRDESIWRAVE